MLVADANVGRAGNHGGGSLANETSGWANHTPTPVADLTDVASGGAVFRCARKTNGAVWCHGYAEDSGLSDGLLTGSAVSVQVQGLTL
ncbi:MAG: hypothetical protein ACI855_003235 [Myxococcota bacterium]|jgi:hypothetical protein